jgi:hypothetical protein
MAIRWLDLVPRLHYLKDLNRDCMGLYAIIMVAPSSPTALTHDIMMPMIIPLLANGSEILKKGL